MDEQEQYERAKKRVAELKGFYTHLAVYVLVIGFLAMINLFTSPSFLWVLFPASGWGIGLGAHAVSTFFETSGWEERKINEIMAKERGEKLKRGSVSAPDEDYFE